VDSRGWEGGKAQTRPGEWADNASTGGRPQGSIEKDSRGMPPTSRPHKGETPLQITLRTSALKDDFAYATSVNKAHRGQVPVTFALKDIQNTRSSF
jgi:hypothetical protein